MGCIEEMSYEILLGNTSFKECADFIKENYREIYYVPPGYKIFDVYLIGVPPIPLGVDDDFVILPYIKPCHGSFVLKVPGAEEIKNLRSSK